MTADVTVGAHVASPSRADKTICSLCSTPAVVSDVHHPRAATLHLGGSAWAHPDLAPLVRDLYDAAGQLVISRHPDNPRRGDHEAIVKSVISNGVYTPPKVQTSTSYVVAGNHSLDAMLDCGATRMPWVWLDVDDNEARRIMLDDNHTAELGGYDQSMLLESLRAAQAAGDLTLTSYTHDDVAELEAAARAAEQTRPARDPDTIPPVPEKPVTQPGDVWQLGEHRVLCGDCRDPEQVRALLGDVQVNLAFTSPPYASQRTYDESSGFRPIPPDEYVDWFDAVQENVRRHLAGDGSWFVNIKEGAKGGQRHLYVKDLVARHVRELGWLFVDEFCWVRPSPPGRWPDRFKNGWEPVYHFARGRPKFRPKAVGSPSDSIPVKSSEVGANTDGPNGLHRPHRCRLRPVHGIRHHPDRSRPRGPRGVRHRDISRLLRRDRTPLPGAHRRHTHPQRHPTRLQELGVHTRAHTRARPRRGRARAHVAGRR